MSMGRPIGQNVRSVCLVLQRIGPAGRLQLAEHLPEMTLRGISKSCLRAVELGFATTERINGTADQRRHFNIWTVKPHWAELMDAPWAHLKSKDIPYEAAAPKSTWSGVNSVFQIGG